MRHYTPAVDRAIKAAIRALSKYPGDPVARNAANDLKAILARHDE